MASLGPIGFLTGAADELVWARFNLQQMLTAASLGPIKFPAGTADALVWAHFHLQQLLEASPGPIKYSIRCRRYACMGPFPFA